MNNQITQVLAALTNGRTLFGVSFVSRVLTVDDEQATEVIEHGVKTGEIIQLTHTTFKATL